MYASLWVDGRSGACLDTMPLEATMLVLDNSEWMRNGDYTPVSYTHLTLPTNREV